LIMQTDRAVEERTTAGASAVGRDRVYSASDL
jgi:hypothetical protein